MRNCSRPRVVRSNCINEPVKGVTVMRIPIALSIVLLASCYAASPACAQCLDVVASPMSCHEDNGCSGTVVTAHYVPVTQGSTAGSTSYVWCCNATFPDQSLSGNICPPEALKSPESQRQLAELALTRPLLVADCQGYYQPFVATGVLPQDWSPDRRERARLKIN